MEEWRSPTHGADLVTSMRDVRYSKPQCKGRCSSASERDGGLEMLGKCTNPSCSASFPSLKRADSFVETNPRRVLYAIFSGTRAAAFFFSHVTQDANG